MDATKKTLYMHHYNIQLRITTQPSVTRFNYLIQFVGQLLHNHKQLMERALKSHVTFYGKSFGQAYEILWNIL